MSLYVYEQGRENTPSIVFLHGGGGGSWMWQPQFDVLQEFHLLAPDLPEHGRSYSTKYADPVVSGLMRQTDHPLVAAGPAFQFLRGLLLGIVFYLLRDIIFPKKYGWLTMWLVLVIVGILAPFAAAPSSIEGMLYTVLPMWFHVSNFPEILLQSGLLAWLTYYWVNHPEKKWLSWVLWIILAIVLLLSTLGALSALGILPSAG